MTHIRKIALSALAAALIICLTCPLALAEEILTFKATDAIKADYVVDTVEGAKVITDLWVTDSSSPELEKTDAATMSVGDVITFQLEADVIGEMDGVTAIVTDKSVVDLSFSKPVFSAEAKKAGVCKITFRNVLRNGKYGKAKLILTFTVVYDPTESITLDHDELTIKKGQTQELKATVLPSAADPNVKWTSSNTSVATVGAKGVVKGVERGQATITCSTSDGKQATCLVTVLPKKLDPQSVTLDSTSLYLLKGKSKKLVPTVLPDDANKTVTWTTSDKTIAKVSSKGVVKGVNPGTATITCTTNQVGLTATCDVVILAQYADPASVTLNTDAITILKGDKQKLIASVLPLDANPNVTWTSSSKGIAKVNKNGVVTGVKPGTATITCKTKKGEQVATCEVTITPKI